MAIEVMQMKLDTLSLKERIALCRRAASAVVRRLNLLGQWADPKDGPLRRFFEKLVRDEERHLAAIGRFDNPVDEAAAQKGRDLDPILASFFPSLSKGPGEAFIDRESGPYLAECLGEESARFYRALADQAPDEESRAFFHDSEEHQARSLEFVRNVLL